PAVAEDEVREVALRARELACRGVATRDRNGPGQLGDVAEAPAVVRPVQPVRGGDAERVAFRIDHGASLRSTGGPLRRFGLPHRRAVTEVPAGRASPARA